MKPYGSEDSWRRSAFCLGLPIEWFYSPGAPNPRARRICALCSVRVECLDEALVDDAVRPRWHRNGFRGGMSANERTRLLEASERAA